MVRAQDAWLWEEEEAAGTDLQGAGSRDSEVHLKALEHLEASPLCPSACQPAALSKKFHSFPQTVPPTGTNCSNTEACGGLCAFKP